MTSAPTRPSVSPARSRPETPPPAYPRLRAAEEERASEPASEDGADGFGPAIVLRLPDLNAAAETPTESPVQLTWGNLAFGCAVVLASLLVFRMFSGHKAPVATIRPQSAANAATQAVPLREAMVHRPIPTWKVPTSASVESAPAAAAPPAARSAADGPVLSPPSGARAMPADAPDRTSPFYVPADDGKGWLNEPAPGVPAAEPSDAPRTTSPRTADRRADAMRLPPGRARFSGVILKPEPSLPPSVRR
jgi:hypothetical protein